MSHQPQILLPLPNLGRFLTLRLRSGVSATQALEQLASIELTDAAVLGLGEPLLQAAKKRLEGLRTFPQLQASIPIPSTQEALWLFLGGTDAGDLLLTARRLILEFSPYFEVVEDTSSFLYAGGRDLTGYEDGTENPKGEDARKAAILESTTPGLDGSSFVAVQRWVHDLKVFSQMSLHEADHVIGRAQHSNEELPQAPLSAHVKRTAQESFEPPAFMLRRSMPWGNVEALGLVFVAYGKSFNAYEQALRRMAGLDDGITDALFRFSRPQTGGYYWCPPLRGTRLDLQAIGV